ncbi:MAG: FeoA family protein [Spirochaetota bacterium]
MVTLSEIKPQESCVICKILGENSIHKSFIEMGLIPGEKIHILKIAPFKGPIEVRIADYNVALRRSEAEKILVKKL